MGLELKATYKGVECDYWRVQHIECVYQNGTVGADTFTMLIVKLALYVDMATRAADVNNVLLTKQYVFPHRVWTDPKTYVDYMPAHYTREAIYNVLKQLPEFAGAKDV